eukprot:TRINITY_DN888_c0_g1_i1.p1 TRINITY_DN888_c0_g1~~TRINITY_DN888_c0_g1_i1.p1  ORF type:complete len:309 (-),score=85.33 TRINITY_DN888_c0_g1_i1:126-1052(-)
MCIRDRSTGGSGSAAMRSCLWISALLLAASVVAATEDQAANPFDAHPIELTDADLDASVSDGRVWMVMFYAPWCGHCKRALPMMDKLTNDPAILAANVQIAKIDGSGGGSASMQKWAVERAGLGSFPSMLRFHEDKVWAHSGKRELADMIRFSTAPESAPIAAPGPVGMLITKLTGYGTQAMRWVTGQSYAVVIFATCLMLVGLLCLGFLMGYYWREWQVQCWVNVRWGQEGRFYPFALVPIDASMKMIRKDKHGKPMALKSHIPGDGSEVYFVNEQGKECWVPGMQQLCDTATPPVAAAEGDKQKPE